MVVVVVSGLIALIMTALTAFLTNSFPFPFYVGIFYVGPLAFIWFLIPAVVVPVLIGKVPVKKGSMRRVVAVSAIAFGTSALYLRFAPSFEYNNYRDPSFAMLWLAMATLTVIAGIGWFTTYRRAITWAYHLVLATWFFALGFPYLGEFL
jgi:hypothetical protein